VNKKEITEKLNSTNADQVKAYIEILDRLMLQMVIQKTLNEEEIKTIISYWQKQIKTEINMAVVERNKFLMGTPMGRLASFAKNVKDGEELRLSSLDSMNVAVDIAKYNYCNDYNEEQNN